ncbi:MAG: PhoU domain-containing protein [Synergistota bacterium]|nr:PhoU domain-containing protein [Synergistota bacterium]
MSSIADIQSHLYRLDKERIVSLVVKMGKGAARLLENAVHAFLDHDEVLARRVIKEDDTIDRMESEVDQECLASIALRSPAREELYFILAVLKIITDLERIGDQAVNIAEKAPRVAPGVAYPRREVLLEMLSLVLEMFAKTYLFNMVAKATY